MEKRKVHLVLETGSLSGGVRIVAEVANRLAARDWEVLIWSVNPEDTLTSWMPLHPKVEWVSFYRTGTIQDYEQLAYVLAKQSGIKVATYWRTAYPVTACSKPGEGYYLIQDVESSYSSIPMVQKNILDTYELGLHHFTTSRWVEKQLNADYMGIAIDTDFYKRDPRIAKDRLTILAVARQQSLKGWDILTEVMRRLSVRGLGVTLFGLSKEMRVFVPPAVYHHRLSDEEIRNLYNSSYVFLSTSRHEGFNLTALEAMACGTPVVKTPDDGSDEYVDDGGNCLIGKDAQELVDKILSIMSNNELYRSISGNGVITAKAYQWPKVIDRLEKIFTT